jgi:hypothetical protein
VLAKFVSAAGRSVAFASSANGENGMR